jgi:acetyl esterase/lipase
VYSKSAEKSTDRPPQLYRDDLETGGAWPAHHDAACALAWVYANAGAYGLDAAHMVGFGNSYGVSLVADLAMADDPGFFLSECPNTLPESKPFSGVVAFGAGTFGLAGPEMTFATEEVAQLLEQMGLFEGSADEILALTQAISKVEPTEWATHGAFGEQETRVAQVWPAYWADPGDPPFLIMTGDQDLDFWTLRDRVAFAELLQGLGIEATHVLLPDTGHTTFGRDASAWQAPLGEFLDQVLKSQ